MSKIHSISLSIFLIAAFIGFFDASYLSANHLLGTIPPCIAVSGCESVTTSQYSKILGIPVAIIGSLYYLSACIVGLYYLDKRKKMATPVMVTLGTIGFLMSLWFLYVQAFLIGEFCTYCLISAGTSTTLFVTSILVYREAKKTLWQKIESAVGL